MMSGDATAQPSRRPGARILEKLPTKITRPSVSRLFKVGSDVPLITDFAVGRVFKDDEIEAVCQLDQAPAAALAHGDAGGVLKIRNRIEKLGIFRGQQDAFEILHIHAVLIDADGGIARLVRIEGDEGAEECRIFSDDDVAAVDQQFGGQVEALLGALKNQTLLPPCR